MAVFRDQLHLYFCLQALSAPVLSAVGERYYKVTAEALRVCGELVRVVRPNIEVCEYIFFGLRNDVQTYF